jgi:N-acyl homoserine lactone hydrolase
MWIHKNRLMARSRTAVIGVVGLLACVTAATTAFTQTSAPLPPDSLRLYVFDCGTIESADKTENFGLKKEEVAMPGFATPCYLVVHPKGTLMWESGQIPDSAFDSAKGPVTQGMYVATKPLLPQLAQVGYKPADITYFALSHYHTDHNANANAFAGSTWLVQEVEYKAMFSGKVGDTKRFDALRNAKMKLLNGDYDVFGDGTVILKSTPGHSPGHQSLFLKLVHTGQILLSGDLYHYPEERTLDRVPSIDFDPQQTKASRVAIDVFLKQTGTQLWIQHDKGLAAKTKFAPAFYD